MYCAVENQEEEVQDHTGLIDHTTPSLQFKEVELMDECQSTTEPVGSDDIQRDQTVLKEDDRPIAAPMLGDIKMKIKIPYDYK